MLDIGGSDTVGGKSSNDEEEKGKKKHPKCTSSYMHMMTVPPYLLGMAGTH